MTDIFTAQAVQNIISGGGASGFAVGTYALLRAAIWRASPPEYAEAEDESAPQLGEIVVRATIAGGWVGLLIYGTQQLALHLGVHHIA